MADRLPFTIGPHKAPGIQSKGNWSTLLKLAYCKGRLLLPGWTSPRALKEARSCLPVTLSDKFLALTSHHTTLSRGGEDILTVLLLSELGEQFLSLAKY